MATRGQSETAGRASVTTRVRVGPGLIGLRPASLRSALSDERVVMIAAFVVLRAVEIAHSPTSFPDTGTYLPLNFLGYQERLWKIGRAHV